MTQEMRGGTRWRLCIGVLIAGGIPVLVMAALTFLGGLPLNIAISGQDFKIASRPGSAVLAPTGVAAYVDLTTMKNGRIRPTMKAGIDEADISDGLCISMVLTFPKVGPYTIRLETTGRTRARGLQAHVDYMAAKNAQLGPETSDGELPKLDLSNVVAPARANIDGSDVGRLGGGHAGTLGLDIPGRVTASELRVAGQGAVVGGTLRISGIRLPQVAHGRGVEHGECFQGGN